MRLNNIEFTYSSLNKSYELIKHCPNDPESPYIIVIAFFEKDSEGYNMRTVGNRFFLDEEAFIVGKHAMMFLNEIFPK